MQIYAKMWEFAPRKYERKKQSAKELKPKGSGKKASIKWDGELSKWWEIMRLFNYVLV